MAVEIERKFLVDQEKWQAFKQEQDLTGKKFQQGYLNDDGATVRVRIQGDKGMLTIKGKTVGLSRMEFEYEIPLADAEQMLSELCGKPLIEKHRYFYQNHDHTWEVDEFEGENQGLIVAEVELPSEDAHYEKPHWVGEDVSHDKRYFNAQLAKKPYNQW